MRRSLMKLLSLLVMLCGVLWLGGSKAEASASCGSCESTLSTCTASCADIYILCLIDEFNEGAGLCPIILLDCQDDCLSAHDTCAVSCGAPGMGGNGPSCSGSQFGFAQGCIDLYKDSRDDCLVNGSTGSVYTSC